MRCKKHYTDLSSSIGVCACCLRERLLSLLVAEEEQALDRKQRIPSQKFDHSSVAVHHTTDDHNSNKKKSFIRFFSFQNIFRSKNRNSLDSISNLNPATIASSSWFSSSIPGGRKPSICVDDSVASGVVQQLYCRDRGISPVRNSDLNMTGDEDKLRNAIPRRTPGHSNLRRGGHVRKLSLCLSPLVRASPSRQRNQADEMRGPMTNPHLSITKSFCANRSRKLANFGRPGPNR